MPAPYSGLEIFITVNNTTYTADELGVQEMSVTDVDEGDNEIALTIPDPHFRIIDGGVFKVGQVMGISWGYANGQISQQRTGYVVLKPSVTYNDEGVVCKVSASTKSATLAARRPQKTFGKTSVKTIISDIANRNGLKLTIKGGNEKLNAFAHGAWSDREVVTVLADRFGYQATYDSETLVFTPRDYGATPTVSLVFAQGGEASNIIEADLEVDAKKSLGDSKTTAISVDPHTKKVITATSQEAPKALAISAENGHSWVAKINSIAQRSSTNLLSSVASPLQQPDINKIISSPDAAVDNLGSLASSESQLKQKKKGELSITSTGIIHGTARQIVTVKGLAKRDSGNWYAVSVEHCITQDAAYTTKWELNRHGNNTKGTDKNTSPLNDQNAIKDNKVKHVVAIDAETGKATKQ